MTHESPRLAPVALLLSCVAAAGGVAVSCGSEAPTEPVVTRIDVSALGPQVGERVPDFSLPDQHGRTQTLASIMGPRGAVLVFVRSADW